MATYYYAAFIPSETGYSIIVPDLPEVASQGETVQECMEMATEAVALVIEEYAKARKPMPKPSDLDKVKRKVEAEMASLEETLPDTTLFQLIQAPSIELTPVKISISMAKSTLDTIDAKARSHGMTRSGFLVAAAQAYK